MIQLTFSTTTLRLLSVSGLNCVTKGHVGRIAPRGEDDAVACSVGVHAVEGGPAPADVRFKPRVDVGHVEI